MPDKIAVWSFCTDSIDAVSLDRLTLLTLSVAGFAGGQPIRIYFLAVLTAIPNAFATSDGFAHFCVW